jgi:hypothetical protein
VAGHDGKKEKGRNGKRGKNVDGFEKPEAKLLQFGSIVDSYGFI